MIFKRVIRDHDGLIVKRIYAEVCDGDEFTDKNGDWYTVSISDDESHVSSVLGGTAHDSHIEPLGNVTIFEHFANPRIMRWGDAETTSHHFDYYNSRERRWVRVEELGVNDYGVLCVDGNGDTLVLDPEVLIKLVED